MEVFSLVRASAFALAMTVAAQAAEAATSFRIDQLFSSADGDVQYIVLRESAGLDGEQAIGGLVLRATGGGTTREYTLPRGLFRTHSAGKTVVIATQFGVPGCCVSQQYFLPDGSLTTVWQSRAVSPDYSTLPARFLTLDGGTVEIVGVDAVSHGVLPTSGYQALDRAGQVVPASFMPYWIATYAYPLQLDVPLPVQVLATSVYAREYYHPGLDRYFVAAQAQDIAAIESGLAPGWTPTENWGFVAYSTTGTFVGPGPSAPEIAHDTAPVCRYYLPPPRSTHYFSAFPDECAATAAIPGAILESAAAFYVYVPDRTTGSCGDRYPIYRLWNGRAEANHRWTASEELRADLVAQGWVSDGAGPLGVAFCGSVVVFEF